MWCCCCCCLSVHVVLLLPECTCCCRSSVVRSVYLMLLLVWFTAVVNIFVTFSVLTYGNSPLSGEQVNSLQWKDMWDFIEPARHLVDTTWVLLRPLLDNSHNYVWSPLNAIYEISRNLLMFTFAEGYMKYMRRYLSLVEWVLLCMLICHGWILPKSQDSWNYQVCRDVVPVAFSLLNMS